LGSTRFPTTTSIDDEAIQRLDQEKNKQEIRGQIMSSTPKKLAAEFIGTFWLVLGGCGSAVLAANFPGAGPENSL